MPKFNKPGKLSKVRTQWQVEEMWESWDDDEEYTEKNPKAFRDQLNKYNIKAKYIDEDPDMGAPWYEFRGKEKDIVDFFNNEMGLPKQNKTLQQVSKDIMDYYEEDDNYFFIADDKGRYPLSVSNRYSFYAEQGILPKSLPKSKTKSNKFRR